MTRIISVISGKGGTGKTTVASNLGKALSDIGEKVLLIDANLSGANLSQHFGVNSPNVTLNNVLEGEAFITQAMYRTEGLSIIPASILDFKRSPVKLKYLLYEYIGDKDFILIDAAAGLNREVEAAIEASDEVLIVTEPQMTSITNSIGALELSNEMDKRLAGVVINNKRRESSELSKEDVENVLGLEVIGEIPEHKRVRESIVMNEPVVSYSPASKPAKEIKDIAYRISGREKPNKGLFSSLKPVFEEFKSIFSL